MKKLVIAEKSSAGNDIATFLAGEHKVKKENKGSYIIVGDYVVAWARGHLLEQKEAHEYDEKYKFWNFQDLPIIPQPFELRPVMSKTMVKGKWESKPDAGADKLLRGIKSLLSTCEIVINAGDAGREGQVIVDELLTYFKNKKPVYRLWLNGLNNSEMKKGFNNLYDNKEKSGLYRAGVLRAQTDWLVGINFSRAISIKFKEMGLYQTFSVGRVQTPVLKLLYDKNKEINEFKSKDFYDINARFINLHGNEVDANLIIDHKTMGDYIDDEGRIVDAKYAKSIKDDLMTSPNKANIQSIKNVSKTENQGLMYSLSTLQQECNRTLKISVAKTLEYAQMLYEAKLTTYPRTSSNHLPESMYAESPQTLKMLKGFDKVADVIPTKLYKTTVWNDAKLSDHHAIIPLEWNQSVYNSLPDEAKKIYELIVRRYISHFYPPKSFIESTMIIGCKSYNFKTTVKSTKDAGWTVVYGTKENNQNFDDFTEGAELNIKRENNEFVINLLSKKTTPPKYFDGAALIGAMKNISKYLDRSKLSDKELEVYKQILNSSQGLGEESTRSAIIDKLIKINLMYFIPKTQNIDISEKGIELIKNLLNMGLDDVCSPAITAQLDQMLTKIETNELSENDYNATFNNTLKNNLQIINKANFKVSEKLMQSQKDAFAAKNNPEAKPSKPIAKKTYKKS